MDQPQPIWCRVYNPALGKWAAAGIGGEGGAAGTLTVGWTHDPERATVLESHGAEALAEAVIGISRVQGLGWEQVYAERAGRAACGRAACGRA